MTTHSERTGPAERIEPAERTPQPERTGHPRARAPRVPFAVLLVALVLGGMGLLLLLNTASAANELSRHGYAQQDETVAAQVEQLQNEIAASSAPANLAQAAQALGMVPAGNPAFLVPGPDGRLILRGSAAPVTAPPLPPPPAVKAKPAKPLTAKQRAALAAKAAAAAHAPKTTAKKTTTTATKKTARKTTSKTTTKKTLTTKSTTGKTTKRSTKNAPKKKISKTGHGGH